MEHAILFLDLVFVIRIGLVNFAMWLNVQTIVLEMEFAHFLKRENHLVVNVKQIGKVQIALKVYNLCAFSILIFFFRYLSSL